MRHFAQELRDKGRTVHNHRLDDIGPAANLKSLGAMRQADISLLAPQSVVMTAPGDWVFQQLKAAVEAAGLKLEVCEDQHFLHHQLKRRDESLPLGIYGGQQVLKGRWIVRQIQDEHDPDDTKKA